MTTIQSQNSDKIVIGKVQNSLIKEDISLITLNNPALKTSHIGIFGKSGSGKTYTMISSIFGYIKSSLIQDRGDSYILIDPHNSFLPPLFSILNDYLLINNGYSDSLFLIEYVKKIPEKDYGNKNMLYCGYKMKKTLIFNPLICPDLKDNCSLLNIHKNSIISSLKGCFDFSSFGPKNTAAIEGIVYSFLVFNALKLRNGEETSFYSLTDIYSTLDSLQKTKKCPNYVQNSIKELSKSEYPDIQSKAQKIDKFFLYLEKNVNKDPSYYDTAITKFSIFSYELGETFGDNKTIPELTLDLQEMMRAKINKTYIYSFNLEDFSMDERMVIIAFLIAPTYFYGSRKNHTLKNLSKHYIIVDEFQSFLNIKEQKNPFITLLEKAFNELRKFSIVYILAYQSVSYELKDLLNNLGVFIVFSLPPEQGEFFLPLINSGIGDEITEKDIANLNRGNFYIVFDTINIGVQTISGYSGDFQEEDFRRILLSNSTNRYEK